MLIVSLVTTIAGGLAGGWLVWWYIPDLRPTREGRIATWIVRVLVGSAVGLAALQIYLAIHNDTQNIGGSQSERAASVIAQIVTGVIPVSGILLALAAIVYLLGPVAEDG
jgi:hypothetical protein